MLHLDGVGAAVVERQSSPHLNDIFDKCTQTIAYLSVGNDKTAVLNGSAAVIYSFLDIWKALQTYSRASELNRV